mmetsp:Transcript_14554/g.30202  ORF Transcript_14554/g.30202 Transcript_14554/m.30202 type:complete len:407 (-) Transcript_14554:265-1485(-)
MFRSSNTTTKPKTLLFAHTLSVWMLVVMVSTTTMIADRSGLLVAEAITSPSSIGESSLSKNFRAMHAKIAAEGEDAKGAFVAALDQSGGSTPKALASYGMSPEDGNYEIGTESMYDAVHAMRTRIMTSPSFGGDRILGAILFENTMDRSVEGLPTCRYLWERKGIVPFLKIDKGLQTHEAKNGSDGRGVEIVEGEAGVQLLKPIPELEALLERARLLGVYGTKARSLILNPSKPEQIEALVRQQFALARRVLACGLVPIIEPEVDVTQNENDKRACEEILCGALVRELDALMEEAETGGDETDAVATEDARTRLGEALHKVMIKISLPETPGQYQKCVDHPCCLRVVALSGGYDQKEANERLSRNHGVIASFSRALAEGLSHGMTEEEFNGRLSESISEIYDASAL